MGTNYNKKLNKIMSNITKNNKINCSGLTVTKKKGTTPISIKESMQPNVKKNKIVFL